MRRTCFGCVDEYKRLNEEPCKGCVSASNFTEKEVGDDGVKV